MIVLFNVKITDIRMGYPYTRGGWMPNPERFDVFRYCLASTAVLEPLVSKFIFCITLAPELIHRQAELDEYINSLFPAEKLELIWQRCDYGRDWKRVCDQYLTDPDEIVWLACNDDHIFIDNDLDTIESAINWLTLDPNPNAVMYYSHWPEQMRMSRHYNGELTSDGDFIRYEWETYDGIMMLKAGRLKDYWLRDYGDAQMFIPPGFFENDIKIAVGFQERDDSWTNFNPSSEWLYNFHPNGTDYRWVEEDIPLFWRSRLGKITHSPDYDTNFMYQARDAAFLAATRVPMRCFDIEFTHANHHPKEWFRKNLFSINS